VVSFNSGRYVTLKYFLSYAKRRKSYHRQNHAGRTEQYRHRGVEQTNRLSWLADIDWLSYTTLPDSAFALHQWMKWMKWINQSVNQWLIDPLIDRLFHQLIDQSINHKTISIIVEQKTQRDSTMHSVGTVGGSSSKFPQKWLDAGIVWINKWWMHLVVCQWLQG